MRALLIVEPEVPLQPGEQLLHALVVVEIDVLVLEASPEPLDEDIIQSHPVAGSA